MVRVLDLDNAFVIADLDDTAKNNEALKATTLMHNDLLMKEKLDIFLEMHVNDMPRTVWYRSVISGTMSSNMLDSTTKELTNIRSRGMTSNCNEETERASYKQMRQTRKANEKKSTLDES